MGIEGQQHQEFRAIAAAAAAATTRIRYRYAGINKKSTRHKSDDIKPKQKQFRYSDSKSPELEAVSECDK